MPRLTVFLSSFNRPARLKLAIESVLAQTYKDFKLLILDDNSPNPAVHAVINEFAELDPRVDALYGGATPEQKKLRCTFGALLNQGIRITDSEFTSWLCDSATYYPKRCERLIAHLDANLECSAVWGVQRWQRVDAAGNVIEDPPRPEVPGHHEIHHGPSFVERLSGSNFIDHNSVAERRTDIMWTEDPAHWFGVDWKRWQAIAARGLRMDHVGWLGELKQAAPDSSGWLHGGGKSIEEIVRLRGETR